MLRKVLRAWAPVSIKIKIPFLIIQKGSTSAGMSCKIRSKISLFNPFSGGQYPPISPYEKDIDFAMKRAYDILSINIFTPSFYVRTYSPDSIKAFRNRQYAHMMNSKDYLAGLNTIIQHDIYKSSKSNPDNIKNVVKADILIIISQQDHEVNPTSSIAFSKLLDCGLVELTGDCGHIAPWCESEKVKKAISSFLK